MKIKIYALDQFGSKIPPIKAVRFATGLGLKDGKDVVDEVWAGHPQVIDTAEGVSYEDIKAQFDTYGVMRWEVVRADFEDKLGFLIDTLNQYPPSFTVGELHDLLVCTQRVLA